MNSDIIYDVSELKSNFQENKRVKLAGRIMSKREHGRAIFADLFAEGKIQLYAKIDVIGEEGFVNFKSLNLGDIVCVEGETFYTKTRTPTLQVKKILYIQHVKRSLPKEYYGLQDPELRYKQRYLDLILNEEVRKRIKLRASIINLIREFLNKRDFMEVETPILQGLPGGAHARPFVTYHHSLGKELYLRIAPELYLKRLLVAGFPKIYEIGRNFRNEGISRFHNPEFSMLEVYQAYADYHEMMQLVEDLLKYIAKNLFNEEKIKFEDKIISLNTPFRRVRLEELLEKRGKKNVSGEEMEDILDKEIKDELIEPTFVIDYPKETSPLAKSKDKNWVERFELFIGGLEIANAYSELNDPEEQRARFLKQNERMIDEDFIVTLEYGMPPAAGLGIGIDRLVMVFTDAPSIREIIIFPHM